MTDTPTFPINRPLTLATDLGAAVFENVDLVLHEVFTHAASRGPAVIEGRVFRGCRIQGPGIMLVSAGVTFESSNFGDSRGDTRNLVLRSVGDKALGTMPVRNCQFVGCEFYGIGFTGTEEFIQQIVALPRAEGASA